MPLSTHKCERCKQFFLYDELLGKHCIQCWKYMCDELQVIVNDLKKKLAEHEKKDRP